MSFGPGDRRQPWRIGPFELDVASRELSRDGARVRLQEQPFEILCALLERAGDVVTRDELRGRLWPHGTFVDFEHSLNAAVKRLRGALGDDALEPRFIETVPRRGYRLKSQVATTVQTPERHVEAGPRRLAVLPFTDLSDEGGRSAFGDGLTDETIAQLGTICRGRVAVIARRSTLGFTVTPDRVRHIGEVLRVSHVLEGSVRRDNGRVRVTAQLIDATQETLLWSEGYDRRSANYLDAQTDIATRIAHAVAGELASSREASAEDDPGRDAYRAFLKGEYYWNKPGSDGLDQALTYYSEGLALAPTFAAAHAAMGRGLLSRAEHYREVPRHALMRAREAARKALELDPRQAEAHLTLADVSRLLDFDWEAATTSYNRAISLNPAYEGAHRSYALLLSAKSLHVEARGVADRASQLDPFCLQVAAVAAWVRYAARDYEAAIDQCLYTLELEPAYVPARRLLGAAYLAAGRRRECATTFEATVAEHGDDPVLCAWAAHAAATLGERLRAESFMERLQAVRDDGYVPAYHEGLAYLGLGDVDRAFALFEAGYDERDPAFSTLATDSRFEAVRNDSRYMRLLRLAHLGGATS